MPTSITLPVSLTNTAIADADDVMSDLNAIVTRWNADVAALSGDVVGDTDIQTLTNKTLTAPVLSGTVTGTYTLGGTPTISKPIVNGSIQALTTTSDGATVTFDLAASNIHTVTLGGNRTLALSNVSTGQSFVLRLAQDGTGSRTVTWFSTIKWPANVTPTLTTTASKTDVFGFICTSTGNYDGFIVGQNL